MGTLSKTSWLELKLLGREPLTIVFTLALPVVVLFVLGGVFGNQPDPGYYRGVGAMDYYMPAYVGLVLASMGLIGLPVHIASYREAGVLRRFSASAIPQLSIAGGEAAVTVVFGIAGSVLLAVVSVAVYHVSAPVWILGVAAAFVISAIAFAAVGVLLGYLLPTARSAQGVGVVLWFVVMMLSGTGPPIEVLNSVLRGVGSALPLRHVVLLLQDPWLGAGWNVAEMGIVFAFALVAGAGALFLAGRTARR